MFSLASSALFSSSNACQTLPMIAGSMKVPSASGSRVPSRAPSLPRTLVPSSNSTLLPFFEKSSISLLTMAMVASGSKNAVGSSKR